MVTIWNYKKVLFEAKNNFARMVCQICTDSIIGSLVGKETNYNGR